MERRSHKEKRSYPRFLIDLPLEYREVDDPQLRGGVIVNASEGGFLIESGRDIPVGTELNVTVFFPERFQLANFTLVAEIVWKEPLLREDWEGYQYGLNIIRILEEDRWKLKMLLSRQFDAQTFSLGPSKMDQVAQ